MWDLKLRFKAQEINIKVVRSYCYLNKANVNTSLEDRLPLKAAMKPRQSAWYNYI
jgi:hypothetical protein